MQDGLLEQRLLQVGDFVDVFGVFLRRRLQRRQLDVGQEDERHQVASQSVDDRQSRWRLYVWYKRHSIGITSYLIGHKMNIGRLLEVVTLIAIISVVNYS